MHVYGPTHLHGPQSITPPHHGRPVRDTPPAGRTPGGDELKISDAGSKAAEAARLVDQIHHVPEVRQERVDQIRSQLAAGTYETQQKLDVALERLLDEIG